MKKTLTAIIALALVGCAHSPMNDGISLRTDSNNGRLLCARAVMKVEGANPQHKKGSKYLTAVANCATALKKHFERYRFWSPEEMKVSEQYGTVQVEGCAEKKYGR